MRRQRAGSGRLGRGGSPWRPPPTGSRQPARLAAQGSERPGHGGVQAGGRHHVPGGLPCSLYPHGQRELTELCQRRGWRFVMEATGGLVSRGELVSPILRDTRHARPGGLWHV